MSRDSSDQIKLLDDITKIVQTIQLGRYNEKDQYTVDRLHESNLLYQKAYLHGLSILKLSKGIPVEIPPFNKIVLLNDPVSIAILIRGLLETYLTFYHINFAENDDKRDTSFISWIVFGLKQRLKLKFEKPDENLIQTNRKIYDKYNQMYISNMQRLEEEKRVLDKNVEALKRTAVFSSFDLETQKNYIKQLAREWKFDYLVSERKLIFFQKFHIYDFICQGWFRLISFQINVFPGFSIFPNRSLKICT